MEPKYAKISKLPDTASSSQPRFCNGVQAVINRIKNISRLISMVLILLLWCLPARALKNGSEGQEWVQWTPETRVIYIRAFAAGMQDGYGRGCHAGISAISPRNMGDVDAKASEKCWKAYPFLSGDPVRFVKVITDFYVAYPEQRYLDISDVLFQASNGHSAKEIHEHFLKSNLP